MDISLHDAIQGQTFDEKLASITSLLSTKRNIVVLAGAGISVSCGIPDFRSANGLYNTLNYQELGLASPEDLFDLETFIDGTSISISFAPLGLIISMRSRDKTYLLMSFPRHQTPVHSLSLHILSTLDQSNQVHHIDSWRGWINKTSC